MSSQGHQEDSDDNLRHPHPDGATLSKSNPKVLSFILKALIMTFITTLFFLFLGVAAILLALATAAFHMHNNNNPSQRSSSLSSHSAQGLSLKDLKKVPQFKLSKQMSFSSTRLECSICLDSMKQHQWCRRIPGCGHIFHRRCLDSWLVKVPSCPVCRSMVRIGNLQVEEERVSTVQGLERVRDLNVW